MEGWYELRMEGWSDRMEAKDGGMEGRCDWMKVMDGASCQCVYGLRENTEWASKY
jgi:hypothetical protein